ncbi:uncharacterized protein RG961_013699 [Leptosomus discolor]
MGPGLAWQGLTSPAFWRRRKLLSQWFPVVSTIGATIGIGLAMVLMLAGLCALGRHEAGVKCLLAITQLVAMKNKVKGAAVGAAVGAGVALVGIPVGIWALGFTGAGIAAGSLAAKMMSVAAIANNGGVAAGSAVAVLQSVGAAGLSLGTKIGLTSTLGSLGAAAGAKLSKGKTTPGDKPE